ncbi:hypothetical protein WJX77_003284 [Trebouxia sp. C0004]
MVAWKKAIKERWVRQDHTSVTPQSTVTKPSKSVDTQSETHPSRQDDWFSAALQQSAQLSDLVKQGKADEEQQADQAERITACPLQQWGLQANTAPETLHNVKRRYDGKPADVCVVLFAMLFCQYPFDRRQGDPPLQSREYQKLFIERLKHADIVVTHSSAASVTWLYAAKQLVHLPITLGAAVLCCVIPAASSHSAHAMVQGPSEEILHPSPEVRTTIHDTQKHPWFIQNLPAQMQDQDWNSQYNQQSGSNASVDANDESGVQYDHGHFGAHSLSLQSLAKPLLSGRRCIDTYVSEQKAARITSDRSSVCIILHRSPRVLQPHSHLR